MIILKYIFIFLLLIISVTVNTYFGSIGVFPIDSFAFFDSANILNQGFVPFKDYWVMNGFMIDIIQSIFFKYFGVSWQIYQLHSSLVNFFFSITIFFFFLNIGLNIFLSFFYSSLASIISYSVVGVPFPDQHSVFFSLIGFYFLYLGIKKKKIIFWLLLPLPFFIAFLSKQVPAAYYIILAFFIICNYFFKNRNIKEIIFLFLGIFILLISFFLYLLKNEIYFHEFILQYISFPQSIGHSRFNDLNIFNIFFKLINEFKFITFSLIILIYLIIKKKNIYNFSSSLNIKNYFIIFIIIFILIIHQILTKNQNFIFFLIPLILGLSHYELQKKKNILIFSIFLIFLCSLITFKYHLRFNVDRKFMELEKISLDNYKNAELISDKLKGLKWVNSQFKEDPEKEIQQINLSINYLKNVEKRKIILTEYQFLLSEINHNIYSPSRWYTDDGVSYPLQDNIYFNEYKKFFKKNLIKNKIKIIYTIEPINKKSFDFIFESECIKSNKINEILIEHDIEECF